MYRYSYLTHWKCFIDKKICYRTMYCAPSMEEHPCIVVGQLTRYSRLWPITFACLGEFTTWTKRIRLSDSTTQVLFASYSCKCIIGQCVEDSAICNAMVKYGINADQGGDAWRWSSSVILWMRITLLCIACDATVSEVIASYGLIYQSN